MARPSKTSPPTELIRTLMSVAVLFARRMSSTCFAVGASPQGSPTTSKMSRSILVASARTWNAHWVFMSDEHSDLGDPTRAVAGASDRDDLHRIKDVARCESGGAPG